MDKAFYSKIQTVIENNDELKNSYILKAVLESVEYNNESQYLSELKARLTEVNDHLNNDELAQIIQSLDAKLGEVESSDLDSVVNKEANEFDTQEVCDTVCNLMNTAEPEMVTKLNGLKQDQMTSGRDSYCYIPVLQSIIGEKLQYDCLKESYNNISKYLENNKEKLAMVDAIRYFSKMGAYAVNPAVTTILKECLQKKEYNPDVISMKMGSLCENKNVVALLDTLRSIRKEKCSDVFDLSEGKNDTSVYTYMGPVLREGKSVTLYVDNTFINVTPNKKSGDSVKSVINEGVTNVYELSDISVYKNNNKFYNTVKAFESLGFQLEKGGVCAKLSRSRVNFQLNENKKLDFYINGNKMNTISEAKGSDVLAMESTATKACLYNLLENVNTIYNIPFVKFLINEKKGKASMIMDIANDYYVYDFVDEAKTNVYKLDGYKLYEFCLNEYGFDISSTFNFEVSDKTSKINKIEEHKSEILSTISKYKENIAKIDEAKKSDIREDDRKELDELTKTLFEGIKSLQDKYMSLCESEDLIKFSKKDMINEGGEEDEVGQNLAQTTSNVEGQVSSTLDGGSEIEPAEQDEAEIPEEDVDQEDIEQEDIEQEDIDPADGEVEEPDVDEPEINDPDIEEPDLDEPDVEEQEVEEQDVPEQDVEEQEVPEKDAEDIEQQEIDGEEIDQEEIKPNGDLSLREGANEQVPDDAEEINEGEPENEEMEDASAESQEPIEEDTILSSNDAFNTNDYYDDDESYDDYVDGLDFKPNYVFNGLQIYVSPEENSAVIFDGEELTDELPVSVATVNGVTSVFIDPEGYAINLADCEEAPEEMLHEALGLGAIFKRGKIKAAGKKYAAQMKECQKNMMVASAKIKKMKVKTPDADTSALDAQIKTARDQKKTIKAEFEAECTRIFTKLKNSPNRLNKFKRFKAKIENDVNTQLMTMAKELENKGIIGGDELTAMQNNLKQQDGADKAIDTLIEDIKNPKTKGQGQSQGQGQVQAKKTGDPAQNIQDQNNDVQTGGLEDQLAAQEDEKSKKAQTAQAKKPQTDDQSSSSQKDPQSQDDDLETALSKDAQNK